jgi:hypothetical protein
MTIGKRTITITSNLVTLYDPEYPVCFKILKSGHSNCYSVIEEDPFEHKLMLQNKTEVISLARNFEPTFNEQNLPI